jgi:hypothetical protein
MAARTSTNGRGRRPRIATNALVALVLGLGLGASWFFARDNADRAARLSTSGAERPGRTAPGLTDAAAARTAGVNAAASPPLAYDLAEADGVVTALGGAAYYGSEPKARLAAPIVALLPTHDRKGYWLIGADGSVYGFGDARNEGSAAGKVGAAAVVGAAATADGLGYWLLTAAGQVMAFGDARNYGSITKPIKDRAVAIAATTDGKGYWIACSNGGIFSFGDAAYHGSLGDLPIARPVVALAVTPDGGGYWLAGAGGEVSNFGDATRLTLRRPVSTRSPFVGIAVNSAGTGAWLAKQDGIVAHLGTATADGSPGVAPTSRVVSIAAMPAPPSTLTPRAYDLAEADGVVRALGGAVYYGSEPKASLAAPIVALLPTHDRKGYWLIGADGSVYRFGDAKDEGDAGGQARADPVVGAAATADGLGYWLVTADGRVTAFGDATNYGSIALAHGARLRAPTKVRVVGIVATSDGKGYWIATSYGRVLNFGDARNYGSLTSPAESPIVAIAATPDAGGYWLADAIGNAFAFGDAAELQAPTPATVKTRVVGMAVTSNGAGAWMAEYDGTVLKLGTAKSRGSLDEPPASPVISIAAMPLAPVPSPLRFPAGSLGYDINWPQCVGPTSSSTVPLPGPPDYPSGSVDYTVAVVGVDGWAVGSPNPCLKAEVAWAAKANKPAGAPYDLYMFLNSPSPSDTIDEEGPAGTCADAGTRRASCLAYNYGYNSAELAKQYASSEGASSPMWWLDIENDLCGQYWSCDPRLNALTIQGSIDYLHAQKLTVGIYSTVVQWRGITGGYVPTGPQIPIWVAGALWTSPPYPARFGYLPPSRLAPYCGPKYAFAGGSTWLLQETPGPNNYPFDPDYAC